MPSFRNLALVFALTGLGFAACDKDKDDDGDEGGEETGWQFRNTADKAGFQTKLAELEKLSTAAERGALPKGQTRSSKALALVESYAGLAPSQSDAAAPGCEQLIALFGFGGDAETRGSGFSLTDGGSCGDAVREMKSFYSQSLDALAQQIARFKTIAPGAEICGMRVEELAVDPGKAAAAFRLVPVAAPAGLTFEQKLLGAANDAEVGYQTSVKAACAAGADCGSAYQIAGSAEAVGNVAEKKLKFLSDFAVTMAFEDPKHGGMQDVTTRVKSESEVTGLGDQDLLKASEATAFELVGDPSAAPGAAPYKVTMTLNVEEIGDGKLRVTGSFLTNDSGLQPQTFKVEFQKAAGSCSVRTRVPESEGQDPGKPGVAFDDTRLQGKWITECASGNAGVFGYDANLQESATFEAGRVMRTYEVSSDAECFPGKETASVILTGSYELTSELPDNSRYDEVSEYGLNLTYDFLTVRLSTDSAVQTFNSRAICNKTDWAKEIAAQFPAGQCYFDLGSFSLLNDSVLRGKAEFTAVRPFADLLTLDMAQSTFFSGGTETTRSRITTGSVRKLKHL